MNFLAIIPARYASTRLPGKPLLKIGKQTMIQRVYQQCSKVAAFAKVVVATDDERIVQEVKQWNGNVVLTKSNHQSGTDRCSEVLAQMNKTDSINYDFVINVQGDEPFIQPEQLEDILSILTPSVEIGTLIKTIDTTEELFDPNKPKVIIRNDGTAIYFSRHPIPYQRGTEEKEWLTANSYFKHIGIYAYRSDILTRLAALPVSGLEIAESLEQLRWIENGFSIQTKITNQESLGIDTEADLRKAIHFLGNG